MAQVINEYRGLGNALGTGFGQGFGSSISQALSHLAQAKVDKMRANEDIKLLSSLGVNPEEAGFIGRLPAEQRSQVIGKYLDAFGQQSQQQVAPQQQPALEQRAPVQQQSLANLFAQPNAAVSPDILQSILRSPARQQQERQIAAQEQQQIRQQAEPEVVKPIVQVPAKQPEAKAVARRPSLSSVLNPKEVEAQRKAEKEARIEEFNREKLARAETKKYLETLKDQEKAAKESELRLKRMETLIEKGKLPNAGLWTFLTSIEDLGPIATGGAGALIGSAIPGVGTAVGAGVGGILGALSGPLAGAAKSVIKAGSPDIEEFEKLSADFVKNAKQYFGSRLTDADLRVFMQTLPTLMQTDAGKKKVIENLSALNELAQIESKTARSIIRDNGGIPPIDIEQQVKDKIADKTDRIAKRFIGQ